MKKRKVLFLCTGNSARSQMSEAFLRKYGGNDFEPFSAGLDPKGIHPLTLLVMAELEIDISAHYSKSLDEYRDRLSFDYLITVCGHADENCPFFPGTGTRLHWEFEDPAVAEGTPEMKLQKFREVRDLVEDRILSWLRDQGISGAREETHH
jgi:arsenate reductase (thioredoxin)